jgi:hypothetical protein
MLPPMVAPWERSGAGGPTRFDPTPPLNQVISALMRHRGSASAAGTVKSILIMMASVPDGW